MSATLLPFKKVGGAAAELSDEALVAACAAGDSAALAALYDRHHASTQRFLRRAWRLDDADLEDVLQLVFMEVFDKAARFERRASVSSWIIGIAVNKARHHVRARTRRRSLLEAARDRWSGASGPTQPDAALAGRRGVERLDAALAGLPEHLRVAFVVCDVEGLPGVEAARALDLREGTLYRRLHEARKILKAAIEEVDP